MYLKVKINHNIFLDEQNCRVNVDELNRLGFTIIRGIHKDTLNALKADTTAFIKDIKKKQPAKNELYNLINSETSIRRKSNEIVDRYLTPWVKKVFNLNEVDFYPVSHIIKPFGMKSEIWHQDAAIVDETKDYSLNVWMPLVDSKYLNGCLWVIPGSHMFNNHHRVFGNGAITKEVLKGVKMHPVYMKRGDILLFHRNIVHGSSNNYLPWDRIAIEGVLMNKNATFIKYFATEENNQLKRYRVEKELFLNDDPKQFVSENNYEYDTIIPKERTEIIADFYSQLNQFEEHSQHLPDGKW